VPGPRPLPTQLEEPLQSELEALVRRHNTPQQISLRAQIVLLAQQGKNNHEIARQLDISAQMARHWRDRWRELQEVPATEMTAYKRLADAPRPGAPATVTPEAYCQIMSLACQPPENFGRPITHWSARELADEAILQGIVATISPRQVGRFLKGGRSQASS
jgi:putative transposase